MILSAVACSLFFLLPQAARAAAAPQSLDKAGLDAFYDRSRPGTGEPQAGRRADFLQSAALVEAPPAPVGVPFNGTLLPRVAFPHQASVAAELVKAIDHTQASLKLILYDLNLPEVMEAIERARDRNPPVQIQVVLDEGHVFPVKAGMKPSPQILALVKDPKIQVRIIDGFDDFGTMHNKIGIFDDQVVEYGSFNWSQSAEKRNYENALFTREPNRVRLYLDYWEWIWKNARKADKPHGPPTLTPGPPRDKARSVRYHDRLFPSVVFSPHGGISQWLVEAIHGSQKSIDIAMFSLYHQGVADALLERKQKGVAIRLVLDRTQASHSPVVKFLREKGFNLRIIGGRAVRGQGQGTGVMHDKYGLFDGEMLETGSHNWTNNGENNNFENANFLNEPQDIAAFQKDFELLWSKAVEVPSSVSPDQLSLFFSTEAP